MRVTITVVCFCISVLLPEILCDPLQDIEKALVVLMFIASDNGNISEILRPSTQGYVEKGAFGFTYKGIFMEPNSPEKEVAIKFTHEDFKSQAVREYKMYWYLNATHDAEVEKYGIPRVFHFGQWDHFFLMAMTLLDKSLMSTSGNVQELDALIICRDFVKALKYIHGRGIRHDNINAGNIMFRRNNAFITDYKVAQKLTRNSNGEELVLGTEHGYHVLLDLLKGDWESFLNTMCEIFNMNINIIKNNTDGSPYDGLEKVFFEFNKHVSDTRVLPYDSLYNMVNSKIQLLSQAQPALLSFIKEEDWQQASLESSTIFDIGPIAWPQIPNYTPVRFNHFGAKYGISENFRKYRDSSHEEN